MQTTYSKEELAITRKLLKDAEFLKLSRKIVEKIIVAAFEAGNITFDELADHEAIRQKVLLPLLKSKDSAPVRIATDYRATILKDARKYMANGHHYSALLFYALYFEHEINGLMRRLLEQKGLNEEAIKGPMRLSTLDKLTWLIDLLGYKRPNQKFIAFLKPLADARNGYVHYKWIGIDPDTDQSKQILERQLNAIEKQIAYFKSYSSRLMYSGNKRAVMTRIKAFVATR